MGRVADGSERHVWEALSPKAVSDRWTALVDDLVQESVQP
jgi:hypothetical protein